MDNAQTFQFIELVQAEEELWNICHKNFKDTVTKNARWTRIGSLFNISGDEAYSKFRNLREKYRREKNKLNDATRSGAAASGGSKWPFMAHMKFVDECYKRRKVFNSNQWKAVTTPVKTSSLPSSMPTPPRPEAPSNSIFSVAKTVPYSTAAITSSIPAHSPYPVPVPSPSRVPVSSAFPLSGPSPSPVSVPSPSSFSVPSPSSVSVPSPPVFVPSTSPLSSGSTLNPLSFQAPSPSSRDENLTAAGLRRKNTSSLEQALSHNTNNIVEVMRSIVNKDSQQPYEYVVQFIRQTLIEIGAERAKDMEKELMETAFKFKYN